MERRFSRPKVLMVGYEREDTGRAWGRRQSDGRLGD
jgi:hypothetical protein